MFLANTCQVIKVHFFRVIINLEPPPIPLHEKTSIKLVSYKFFAPSRRARPPPLSFHCVQPRKFLFLTSTLKKYLVAVKLLSCKNWIGGCGGGAGGPKTVLKGRPKHNHYWSCACNAWPFILLLPRCSAPLPVHTAWPSKCHKAASLKPNRTINKSCQVDLRLDYLP